MVTKRRQRGKKRTARPTLGSLGAAPARRGGGWVVLVLAALVVVNLYVFVWDKKTSVGAIKSQAEAASSPRPPAAAIPAQPLVAPPAPGPGSAQLAPAPAPRTARTFLPVGARCPDGGSHGLSGTRHGKEVEARKAQQGCTQR